MGFVYKNQQFITFQLGANTIISSINRQGMITGYYSPDFLNYYGFIADASQDSINLVPDQFPCSTFDTIPTGINNDGQVVGWANGSFASFFVNGGICEAGFADDYGWTYGLNDAAQVVGQTFWYISGQNQGFVLVPQH